MVVARNFDRALSMTRKYVVSLVILVLLASALFLPNMGRGFIHDDFRFLSSAAFDPLWEGLLTAKGGPFYAPLTWLTFRLEWGLWGQNAFLSASINLLLHIVNVLLVFHFGRYLFKSDDAALIAALAFCVLIPSSVWAVMWIGTRAHLLTSAFYIGTLYAVFWWTRTGRSLAFLAAVILGVLAMFSKEAGITVIAAVGVTLTYERLGSGHKKTKASLLLLSLLSLFGIAYILLRSSSGAVTVSFGGGDWYSYDPSIGTALDNIRAFGWRTFGWMGIFFIGAVVGQVISKRKVTFKDIRLMDLMFPIAVWAIAIAPVILIVGRSGIYTYLPGAFTSLLLAYLVAGVLKTDQSDAKRPYLRLAPVAVLLLVFAMFVVGQSRKWRSMAETSTELLAQMKLQVPSVESNSAIVIEYTGSDSRSYFPDCFASWGLEPAVRLLYNDPTLKGRIEQTDISPIDSSHEIRFIYDGSTGKPQLRRAANAALP